MSPASLPRSRMIALSLSSSRQVCTNALGTSIIARLCRPWALMTAVSRIDSNATVNGLISFLFEKRVRFENFLTFSGCEIFGIDRFKCASEVLLIQLLS